jgi:CRISPR-associated endonuclease/helicase Cas3
MTMERGDFAEFFKAVNGGHKPFKWQERLLDTVLDNGRWPDLIAAPTGAGKTSAIDVHVFATALSVATRGPRLPRRLALVVGRRVLVDDQYARAVSLAGQLASSLHGIVSPERAIVTEVAKLLTSLRGEDAAAGTDESPLVTARLRGGTVPSRAWRDYPAACAVLCATPDMWGSRLLFRGYGTSSLAAPREAGLLAFDSVVLVDEAHLARQLLETARRVSHLTQIAERPLTTVPPLQVVEVSATPGRPAVADRATAAGPITVGVEAADLWEEQLAVRLIRPKPATLLPVADWPASGRQAGKVAPVIAGAVTAMRAEIGSAGEPPSTVGCYVNTVPMALAVADALRRRGLRVVTVCGQVRPADLDRLRRTYPGILSITGNPDVDVLVSTQSLEVGADLDLAGLVTELASGSALAQRAGRGNRLGKRAKAPVTVIVPPGQLAQTDQTRSGPYSAAELNEALDWIAGRAAHSLGLAPWAVREATPPPAHRRRRLYQRPELGDAWYWARTSDNLAAEPELDLWLSDSFEEETSVGITVRDAVPGDQPDALEFVRDLPPLPRETFPVPYRLARAVLSELLEEGQTMVKVRGEEISALSARPGGSAHGPQGEIVADVRPGDVVVIDSSAEIFTRTVGGTFSPPVVAAPSAADPVADMAAPARGRADDVLHYQPQPVPGNVVFRLEWSPGQDRIAGFTQETARRILGALTEDFEGQSERILRDSLAGLLADLGEGECPADFRPVVTAAISLLHGNIKDSNVILRPGDEHGARVVVLDNRRVVADEGLQQVFSPRYSTVRLYDHQSDVADRAAVLASELDLPEDLTNALRLAGEHHDDGKADHRFQKFRLSNSDAQEPLAKSRPEKTRSQVQKQQANPGMPAGWRHEQRSVVDSWAAVQAATGIDAELALRLVGTSHGHGRSWFPHGAAGLANGTDPSEWRELAAELFDNGGWDELIEATHLRYGPWGCAYLEAVLRAADCQVSREGK